MEQLDDVRELEMLGVSEILEVEEHLCLLVGGHLRHHYLREALEQRGYAIMQSALPSRGRRRHHHLCAFASWVKLFHKARKLPFLSVSLLMTTDL